MTPQQQLQSRLKGIPDKKWDLKVIEKKSGVDLVLAGSFRLALPIKQYLKQRAFSVTQRRKTPKGYEYVSVDPHGNVATTVYGKNYRTRIQMKGTRPPQAGWVRGKRGGLYRKTPQGLKLYKGK